MSRIDEKEKKKIKIIRTSLDLFIRKGYGATRMSDIAKEAEISVGNIFNYFPSKEKLYEELIKLGISKMDIKYPKNTEDPIDFFKALITNIFNMLKADKDSAKMFVLMDQALYLDNVSDEIKKNLNYSATIIESGAKFLEEGQKNGKIRPGNPYALAMTLFTSIQGIAQHLAVYPDSQLPEVDWLLAIIKK